MWERSDKLRVLVVDDVAAHRRSIVEMLQSDTRIHVVGMADNGEIALKLVPSLKPDVAILDLAMPRMDGFTFLRLVMAYAPLPVVIVSAQQQQSQMLAALDAGAVDFVLKPNLFANASLGPIRDELVAKVWTAARAHARPMRRLPQPEVIPSAVARRQLRDTAPERILCVGASTGGPRMLHALLKSLMPTGQTAICIAQHMPENFTGSFAQRLDRFSHWQVREATHGMPVVADGCYIAPGGNHLQLVREAGVVRCAVTRSIPADEYVPSVNRLFESAATLFKDKAMAVVLTGMGTDGGEGVRRVHAAGGHVAVEDPQGAVIDSMPKEALRTGCVDVSLVFGRLIPHIQLFCSRGWHE